MLFRSVSLSVIALFLATGAVQAESINQALASAYENNPSIASAFMSVRSAEQAIRMEQGARLPTIGADASVSYSWTDATGRAGSTTSDSIGLGYSQTIFDNGASDAAILAAEATYRAAVHGAQNTEQNVLLSAAQAYVNVITNRRIVQIREENIGFVRSQLQSARDRLELGEGTRLDVAQAEASLAQAEASYQNAVNNLRISEANYERWVGHAPSSLSGGYNYNNLLPASVQTAMERATNQHPALLASNAQIVAAQYRAQETRAGFGPNISLSGSVGAGGFINNDVATQASVSLRLSVPIFTPSRDPAIEQANISEIQSSLDAFATRDQIIEAVRQAWAGIQSATAQIESATAAVAASRLALDAVIDQNEVGQATTLDVLDARATLLTAEEGLASAQAQRIIASYSLLASTGLLRAQTLGLAVQPRSDNGSVIVAPTVVVAPADPWGNLR